MTTNTMHRGRIVGPIEITVAVMVMGLAAAAATATGAHAQSATTAGTARIAGGGAGSTSSVASGAGIAVTTTNAMRTMPPERWARQDPADSLYRAARASLNDGENARAARLFAEIVERHPRSEYAPDALYWRAFALYRVGEPDSLRQALAALEQQRQRYPNAGTRGDAQTLVVRIRTALAQRGDSDAAAAIAESAETINQPCARDEDHELRVAALNALVHMDDERALPIVRQVLDRRDDCSAELRERAMFVVSRMDSPQVADMLLDAARRDPSADVRKQAVFWLSRVDGERGVAAIEEILRTANAEDVREQAVFALSRHDSPRAAELLREFAANAEAGSETQKLAIFHLSRQDAPGNSAFLRSLYERLRDDDLREHLLFSLSRIGGQANYRWLLERALDENESMEVRKQALFSAGRVDDVAIQDLLDLYDRVRDREMKEQLIFVYSRRDEPAAVGRIIEIARGEEDTELRKRAIFWLSRSDDPRAIEVLQEIINR